MIIEIKDHKIWRERLYNVFNNCNISQQKPFGWGKKWIQNMKNGCEEVFSEHWKLKSQCTKEKQNPTWPTLIVALKKKGNFILFYTTWKTPRWLSRTQTQSLSNEDLLLSHQFRVWQDHHLGSKIVKLKLRWACYINHTRALTPKMVPTRLLRW